MADTLFQDVLTAVQAEFTDLTVTSDETSISVVDSESGGEWKLTASLLKDGERTLVSGCFERAGTKSGFFALKPSGKQPLDIPGTVQAMRAQVVAGRRKSLEEGAAAALTEAIESTTPKGYSTSTREDEKDILFVHKDGRPQPIRLRLSHSKVTAILWKGDQPEFAPNAATVWAAMDDLFEQQLTVQQNKRTLMQNRIDAKIADRVARGKPVPQRKIDFTQQRKLLSEVGARLNQTKAMLEKQTATAKAQHQRTVEAAEAATARASEKKESAEASVRGGKK